MAMMYLSMFVFISTVGLSLYKDEKDERAFIFDEAVVVILLYHMVCFTSFVSDPEVKSQVGFSMIVLSLVFMVLKLFPLFISQCKESILHYKNFIFRRKVKKLKADVKIMRSIIDRQQTTAS